MAGRNLKMAQVTATRNLKVEQGAATRFALIRAATELFAEKGYAATSTAEIVKRAEVTRGALYHHFADKDELFRATFESIELEIAELISVAAEKAAGPADRLRAGMAAFLDTCVDPRIQRILLLEGPSVLGWERWRRSDDPRCARGLLVIGLRSAVDAGVLADQPVEPLAELLYGALVQAGLAIAGSPDPEATHQAMNQAAQRLLTSLLTPDPTTTPSS
ncbi:TetR/AcrR family transcriptional regulator [Sphaerisporangium corydalis]|uniref:TetR/AcrR family transcriptional regulator n=1 Tax=Sphaerisporangium corydalis TaxID=1441875 RepID=A0ABV9EH05_9ACTN|nr:TetR/AcrR family transcriptional regulator [Sphaerisporangium corydalis]